MLTHIIMGRARAFAGVAASIAVLSGGAALGATFASLGTPLVKDVATAAVIGVTATGDFNGDGLGDFVVASVNPYAFTPQAGQDPTTPLQIFLGSPNGLIDASDNNTVIAGPAPRFTLIKQIHILDFNRDGKSDIFLTESGLDVTGSVGDCNVFCYRDQTGYCTIHLPQHRTSARSGRMTRVPAILTATARPMFL